MCLTAFRTTKESAFHVPSKYMPTSLHTRSATTTMGREKNELRDVFHKSTFIFNDSYERTKRQVQKRRYSLTLEELSYTPSLYIQRTSYITCHLKHNSKILALIRLRCHDTLLTLIHKHNLCINSDELPKYCNDEKGNGGLFCPRNFFAPVKVLNGATRTGYPVTNNENFPNRPMTTTVWLNFIAPLMITMVNRMLNIIATTFWCNSSNEPTDEQD